MTGWPELEPTHQWRRGNRLRERQRAVSQDALGRWELAANERWPTLFPLYAPKDGKSITGCASAVNAFVQYRAIFLELQRIVDMGRQHAVGGTIETSNVFKFAVNDAA